MAVVGTASAIGLGGRVDAKNNTHYFSPVGVVFFGIEETKIGDGVSLVIGRQRLLIRG